MIHNETIVLQTASGIAVELQTEIIWINPEGRPPGVYTYVIWNNKDQSFKGRPKYYGTYRNETGLIVFQELEKIVLTIPKEDYQGHIERCRKIFHTHSQSGGPTDPIFIPCRKQNCAVCAERRYYR